MSKEMLEITKNFHNTYEKLSKEYSYETREDTKVFDINSNNGKLMYATVNEIVSPILEENKELINKIKFNEKSRRKMQQSLMKQINELEQQCKKQKEAIDKIIEIINYYGVDKEYNDNVILRHILKDMLDILNEV